MLKDAALNFEQSGLHVFSSSFLEGQKGIIEIIPPVFVLHSSPGRNYAILGLVWSSVNFSLIGRIAFANFYPTV